MGQAGRHNGRKRSPLAFAFSPRLADDVFSDVHLAKLRVLCDVIDAAPLERFDDKRARDVLARAEILVTGWGCPRIDLATLALAPRLRLVAHAAGSVKSLIGREVLDAGIVVVNAASANAIPVAEFTLAAILFANKDVLGFREAYRRNRVTTRWADMTGAPVGNLQKTVGIVGLSRIGRRVIELLRPFDLEIVAYDPCIGEQAAGELGIELAPLDEVIARADVLSLHAPALESTFGMIDARRLTLLRDGATLINTARGVLIDQPALQRELVSGRISAVIDVTVPEVLAADSPLYDLPNVLLTPHIAGALGRERLRLGGLVVDEVERFLNGTPLDHAVAVATLHLQA